MTTIGSRFFLLCKFVFGIYLTFIYCNEFNSATCQDTHLLSEYYASKHLEPNAGWHYDFGLLIVGKRKAITMSTLELGQKFSSITAAKQTVNKYIIHQVWSYRTYKSDLNRCWVIICRQAKDHKCAFCIRLTIWKMGNELTILEPHTCPHSVHHNFRLPNTVKMITSNARNLSLITVDPSARSKHIATNEHID